VSVLETLRRRVPHLDQDRPLHEDIAAARRLLDEGALVAAARMHVTIE
jgi:histidine ammonia-lyase